jgi:phage terminase small subunit
MAGRKKTTGEDTRPTLKQERFAVVYAATGNASEAYRQAYDVREGTKEETIHQAACRILKNSKVAARVNELRAEVRERAGVTLESLILELEEARTVGKTKEQAAAMVAATMGKARLTGLDEPNPPQPKEMTINVRRLS